jgi:hypothetical protein
MVMTPEEYYDQQEKVLEPIPKELRGYFSYQAYEDHHSGGYEEVLNALKGAVYDFLPYWHKYNTRIKE